MGGLARRAGVIDTFRGQDAGMLIVDAGDALFMNPPSATARTPSERAKAGDILQAYGLLGVNALAVGEAEIAFGVSALVQRAREANLALLCANCLDGKGRHPFVERTLVEAGGVKVGMLAILEIPETDRGAAGAILTDAGLRTSDALAAANDQAKRLLAEGAEVIVMLAHVGFPRARELAKGLHGVHVMLVGHSGSRTLEPELVNGVFLLEPGRRGQELGHLELRLGDGWTAAGALVDDSKRHTLYREAAAEVAQIRKDLPRASAREVRERLLHQAERARLIARQLREAKPPQARHSLIGRLVELDETAPSQAAMQGFVASRKEVWAAAIVSDQRREFPPGVPRAPGKAAPGKKKRPHVQ